MFDFHSSLQKHIESCYILQRADSNALLNQLVEERTISKFIAKGKRDFAITTYSNFNFSKYYYGATFVPARIAIMMQKENQPVEVMWDMREDRTEETKFIKKDLLVISTCDGITVSFLLLLSRQYPYPGIQCCVSVSVIGVIIALYAQY